MHRHQRLRLRRDRRCSGSGVHQPGDWVNVNKSWCCARTQDRCRSGAKGVANGNDLVTRLDAEPLDNCLFGERAVRRGDRVLHANELGEAALKLGDARALGEGARHDRFGGGICLLATNGGTGDRNANLRRTHCGERISARSGARSEPLESPRRHPLRGGVGIPAQRLQPHPSQPQPLQARQQRDPHQRQ